MTFSNFIRVAVLFVSCLYLVGLPLKVAAQTEEEVYQEYFDCYARNLRVKNVKGGNVHVSINRCAAMRCVKDLFCNEGIGEDIQQQLCPAFTTDYYQACIQDL